MVDYIRDEEEQVERIKAWWQENGTAAVITVVPVSYTHLTLPTIYSV